VSPDTQAWGLRINTRGDALGYSFVFKAPYHERIGVWDRNGDFKTYFDETINTSRLVFNDNNLIVITAVNPPPLSVATATWCPSPGCA